RKRAHAWRKKRIGNQARCELAEKGHLISTKETKITKMEFDGLSQSVIGCAIEVHRTLGPGLLESTYRQCLACELSHAQIPFQMEVPLPVRYKDVLLDCGYRIDLLVSAELIVEVKSVETLLPIHQAQILTYMR